jgi:PAS domain S-box-containing protein
MIHGMSSDMNPSRQLQGAQSLRLVLKLAAFVVGATFLVELAVMFILPFILPPNSSPLFEALLDSTLLSLGLLVLFLPILLWYRNRTLSQVRRSARLQNVLNEGAMVTVANASGAIVFANHHFCTLSGYSSVDLLGANHRLLKSDQHPREFFETLYKTLAKGIEWQGELCNRKKDGSLFWVKAKITPFPDARGKPEQYITVFSLITEQKELEAASAMHQDQVRTILDILDNLGEGVCTLDVSGNITYANNEAERLLGWRYEELAGKNFHNKVYFRRPNGQPLPTTESPIQQSMQHRKTFRSAEEVLIAKDGSALPVTLTSSPLLLANELTGAVAVFSDARDKLLLQQRLIDAKNSAEAATRLKTDFLSTMSHEIRTPLNGVIGMTGLLLDTKLNEEQSDFARTIQLSADSLMSIINDILDYSKIEAGQLSLEDTEFSLRETVENSLDMLATKAHDKGLTLACVVAPSIPELLVGDSTRIRQILLNFLSNAVKFTAKGEVVVSVKTKPSAPKRLNSTDTRPEDSRLMIEISVKDSGIGLDDAAKARLFQPFSQADSSTTRKYGGSGLGLSISRRLVEAMGGEIGLDSQPGEGSNFWVRIPLQAPAQIQDSPDYSTPLLGKYALIAGDTEGCQTILAASFSAWRMRHDAVPDLADLLKKLSTLRQAGRQAPDLIMLGSNLPDASLVEAVTLLRANGHESMVCCLAFRADQNQKAALQERGAVVMQKPIKQSVLLDSLMTALFRRTAQMVSAKLPTRPNPIPSSYRLLLAEDNLVNQKVAVHILGKLGFAVDVVANGAAAVSAVAAGNYALVLMDCQMPEMDGYEEPPRANHRNDGQRTPRRPRKVHCSGHG